MKNILSYYKTVFRQHLSLILLFNILCFTRYVYLIWSLENYKILIISYKCFVHRLVTKKPSSFSHYYVCILKDHINVCVMWVCCWRCMFVCFSIFIFMAIYILFDQKPFWRFDSSKITARYLNKENDDDSF